MKSHEIVGVAVRLLAVALVFDAIGTAAISLQVVEAGVPQSLVAVSVSVGLMLAFAILIWHLNIALARWLLSGEASTTGNSGSWTIDDLYTCGLVLLGTYFLFLAIDDAVGLAIVAALRPELQDGQPMSPGETAAIVSASLRFLGALGLILGSRGIVGLIRKLRIAGL